MSTQVEDAPAQTGEAITLSQSAAAQIKAMKKEIRLAGGLPEKLSLQRKVRDLESKRDVAWRAYDEAAKDIEFQKDKLLDSVEERLGQDVTDETLFIIEFEIV